MAPRDSAATRARVLDAAVEEFSRRGLAGARVDRIAANAPANKRAIYDYFGDKETLFDAAVATMVERLVAAVPWTPDDLPGYTGRLFDYHLAHPEAMRLDAWRNLERPAVDPGTDLRTHRAFVDAIGSRPGGDTADAMPALDLALVVTALARSWPLANAELLAVEGDRDDPDRVARHRAWLVETVARLVSAEH